MLIKLSITTVVEMPHHVFPMLLFYDVLWVPCNEPWWQYSHRQKQMNTQHPGLPPLVSLGPSSLLVLVLWGQVFCSCILLTIPCFP